MPPVDRDNPVRGEASTSQYSLMEFMREFPDDLRALSGFGARDAGTYGVHVTLEKEHS
jgi:hypothetical protein